MTAPRRFTIIMGGFFIFRFRRLSGFVSRTIRFPNISLNGEIVKLPFSGYFCHSRLMKIDFFHNAYGVPYPYCYPEVVPVAILTVVLETGV